jgi:hypothetical protein
MTGTRTIILHYHLFKNAGTSVDAILRRKFGDRWVTREFPPIEGNNTPLVEDWIAQTPDAVAYSSHTMMGPVPQVAGARVITFVLLRDPIERIKSAYRFERQQDADTWGARLAKEHDFEGYVRARLAQPGDRQCRNFQTHRLAGLMPGAGPELERAERALDALTIVGQVERFDQAIADLATALAPAIPDFSPETVTRNQSHAPADVDISPVAETLAQANVDDLALIEKHFANRVLPLGQG